MNRFGVPAIGRIPIAVRMPIVMAALFLAGMIGTSHIALLSTLSELERQVARVGAVYLDGIAIMASPHIVADDRTGLEFALDRAMRLARSVHKHQLLAFDADGTKLAHIVRDEDADSAIPVPSGTFFKMREDGEAAWVGEAVWIDGDVIGYLLAEIDVSDIRARHAQLRLTVMMVDLMIGVFFALFGFVLMRRMLAPLRALTARLDAFGEGEVTVMRSEDLPPASTEFGRLMRSFNAMARAVRDRERLAADMAMHDRSAALGKLAATVAHEVRNPLAGMSNAVATIRRFGDDPKVRDQSLSLLERGLESIGDVVQATLSSHRGVAGQRFLTVQDLEDLRLLVTPEARRRGITLHWSISVGETAEVPAMELRQILLNLLLNACAITPRGGEVRFAAERTPTELRFGIEDQGAGMPAAVARSLEHQEEDPDLPPRGLGTRVVMHLVRELSGKVSVASSPETGTRITLTIPISQE